MEIATILICPIKHGRNAEAVCWKILHKDINLKNKKGIIKLIKKPNIIQRTVWHSRMVIISEK